MRNKVKYNIGKQYKSKTGTCYFNIFDEQNNYWGKLRVSTHPSFMKEKHSPLITYDPVFVKRKSLLEFVNNELNKPRPSWCKI